VHPVPHAVWGELVAAGAHAVGYEDGFQAGGPVRYDAEGGLDGLQRQGFEGCVSRCGGVRGKG
jgi:hypothetical protein